MNTFKIPVVVRLFWPFFSATTLNVLFITVTKVLYGIFIYEGQPGHFILKSSLYLCDEVLKKRFKEEGLTNSIEILKKTKRDDFLSHINLYDKIDLCLDTFPFNGVTTTFEALWKNVPVITRAGYNFNSRCGESILKNANLENFIAASNDEYVEKAVFYANNINELDETRKRLFNKIQETPLFDTKGFSKDFCEGLENMQKIKVKDYK